MRLLFIESDVTVHRWLEAQAVALGLEVHCAPDANAALDILASVRPDAVFADVGSCPFPAAAAGRQLLRVLQARFIPVLFYASSRHLTTLAARIGRRFGGVMPSPFTLTMAVQRVRTAIARRRAREARLVATAQFSTDACYGAVV